MTDRAASPEELARLVGAALAEDIGTGDRTTEWTVAAGRGVVAAVVAKANGVVAGTGLVPLVFASLDPGVAVELRVGDGDRVRNGQEVAHLDGPARAILTGERVALNFLQRLSGIATLTRAYVDAVQGTGARILDTRKTTPGLRALERAAVRAGGGQNHRFGLFDMVLIKENHIRAAGSISEAVAAVRRANREQLQVEVETTTLPEVREAVNAGVDRILLDNMTIERLSEAVAFIKGSSPSVKTEASGGVSLATVREIAGTGVDFISVGALTHSAPALDLSLLVSIEPSSRG